MQFHFKIVTRQRLKSSHMLQISLQNNEIKAWKRKRMFLLWYSVCNKKIHFGRLIAIKKYCNRFQILSKIFNNYQSQIIEMCFVSCLKNLCFGSMFLKPYQNFIKSNRLKKYSKQTFVDLPKLFFKNTKKVFQTDVLKDISKWKKTLSFGVKYKIRTVFTIKNLKKLRNIFITKIGDKKSWIELENFCTLNKFSKIQKILLKIYLNEFDKHIFLWVKYLKIKIKNVNRIVIKSFQKINNTFAKRNMSFLINKNKNCVKMGLKTQSRRFFNENLSMRFFKTSSEIKYIRYKNHFILGIRKLDFLYAITNDRIKTFLKSNLHINLYQHVVFHFDNFLFLGISIAYIKAQQKALIFPVFTTVYSRGSKCNVFLRRVKKLFLITKSIEFLKMGARFKILSRVPVSIRFKNRNFFKWKSFYRQILNRKINAIFKYFLNQSWLSFANRETKTSIKHVLINTKRFFTKRLKKIIYLKIKLISVSNKHQANTPKLTVTTTKFSRDARCDLHFRIRHVFFPSKLFYKKWKRNDIIFNRSSRFKINHDLIFYTDFRVLFFYFKIKFKLNKYYAFVKNNQCLQRFIMDLKSSMFLILAKKYKKNSVWSQKNYSANRFRYVKRCHFIFISILKKNNALTIPFVYFQNHSIKPHVFTFYPKKLSSHLFYASVYCVENTVKNKLFTFKNVFTVFENNK